MYELHELKRITRTKTKASIYSYQKELNENNC